MTPEPDGAPDGVPPLTGEFADFDYCKRGPIKGGVFGLQSPDIAYWTYEGSDWDSPANGNAMNSHYAIRRGTELHRLNFGTPLAPAGGDWKEPTTEQSIANQQAFGAGYEPPKPQGGWRHFGSTKNPGNLYRAKGNTVQVRTVNGAWFNHFEQAKLFIGRDDERSEFIYETTATGTPLAAPVASAPAAGPTLETTSEVIARLHKKSNEDYATIRALEREMARLRAALVIAKPYMGHIPCVCPVDHTGECTCGIGGAISAVDEALTTPTP